MSLLTVLRKGIEIIDKVVKPLEANVAFSKFVRKGDGYGTSNYPMTVTLKAIVEYKQIQVRTPSGDLATCRASVMFIDIDELMAATLGDGVQVNSDRIVLPDGTTGPILSVDGFLDAGTGKPIYTQVYIG